MYFLISIAILHNFEFLIESMIPVILIDIQIFVRIQILFSKIHTNIYSLWCIQFEKFWISMFHFQGQGCDIFRSLSLLISKQIEVFNFLEQEA